MNPTTDGLAGRTTTTEQPSAGTARQAPDPAAHPVAAEPADTSPRGAAGTPSPDRAPRPAGEGTTSPAGSATVQAGTPPAGTIHPLAAAMSEDRGPGSLDAHVRRLIKDLGLRGYHTHDARRSAAGYPDWTIVGPHGVLFRELKRQSGKASPEQQAWLVALRVAGQDACVWRPSHLLNGSIARELAIIAGLRMAPERPGAA